MGTCQRQLSSTHSSAATPNPASTVGLAHGVEWLSMSIDEQKPMSLTFAAPGVPGGNGRHM